jgi:DNA-binding Xre family transcriptional regulator
MPTYKKNILLKFYYMKSKGVLGMDLSEAVRLRIINLMNEKNLNVSKLTTLAGISRSTLSKFLSGHRKIIRLDMIEYICEALDIKLKDFFDDKVFEDIDIEE